VEAAAAGKGFGRVPLALELICLPLAALFQVYEFAAPGSDSLLYHVTDIAWPLSMLLLLITGIFVIRARRFEGWLRFVPLAATLGMPVGILITNFIGVTGGQALAGVHTMIGWFLIAYAVQRRGRLIARY
jgi:hypothetical protein